MVTINAANTPTGTSGTVLVGGGIGVAPSFTSNFKVTSDVMTNTSQPAFYAYLSSIASNVTGDSTVYTIVFDTELFDQSSSFNNSTGTFTAPVTGKYFLHAQCLVQGGTAISAANLAILTNAGQLRSFSNTPLTASTTSVFYEKSGIISMTAGDTATVTITCADSGGKIDDVFGGSGTSNLGITFFSGFLIC